MFLNVQTILGSQTVQTQAQPACGLQLAEPWNEQHRGARPQQQLAVPASVLGTQSQKQNYRCGVPDANLKALCLYY